MQTYPVDEIIPTLRETIEASPVAILSAPPGAGKTTRVPTALLDCTFLATEKVLMLEPRRLAARLSAEFMSSERGEKIGETVGYRIRGESRTGTKTRVEILTEGILTRILQNDPELPGVGLVIFDEFHERSIHADLGLAFCLDVQKHLRNDLRILIMSATVDGARLSGILGNVPIVESKGKLFPVDTRYARFVSDKPVEARVIEVVERALKNDEGDILVFLPGWREIQRVEQSLYERHLGEEVSVHMLHGDAPPASQSAALAPAPRGNRKVILSTNVAETSLTIEGVRVVVDSGLVRVSRFDPRKEMSGLITVPASQASADQRKGRAGRLAPGVCYRLWTEQEHAQRAAYTVPEIKTADLTPLALELARWGTPNGEGLLFPDPPPPTGLQLAQHSLRELEATDEHGKLTAVGKTMSELPIHPRLAHMILRAKAMGLGSMACDVAALLEDRDARSGLRAADVDLSSRWLDLDNDRGENRIKLEAKRLRRLANIAEEKGHSEDIGLVLALSYPDRVAKRREHSGTSYILASGTTASLPAGSTMSRNEFLSVGDVEMTGAAARIRLCASVTKDQLTRAFGNKVGTEDVVQWNSTEKVVDAKTVTRIGAIVLSEQPLSPRDDRIPGAMLDGIRAMGLSVLPWEKEARSLRERSEWLRQQHLVDEGWPDLSEEYLMTSLERWLKPFLGGIRQLNQLSNVDLSTVLKSLFTFRQLKDLELLAPSHLKLPSGSYGVINYSTGNEPVLAVRLQELFGQVETPRIAGGAVSLVLHLLSPAKRPLAVTRDLPSFWKRVYPDILGQMRAQYPKHVWPDDPLHAQPTSKTRRQLHKTS